MARRLPRPLAAGAFDPEAVRNAHSLELEIAAELGLVGLLALAAMVGGVVVAARRAIAVQPAVAAGPAAALLAWARMRRSTGTGSSRR